MTLAELFRKHGSDKDADSGTAGHCYAAVYERLLAGKLLSVTQVLEVGVFGGSSLRAWRDWFPNAGVHGVDINRDKLFNDEERIACFHADQGSPESLTSAVGKFKYDLIVDDGSHNDSCQLSALRTLFPLLKEGGDYVIEDVGTTNLWAMVREARKIVGEHGGEVSVIDMRPARGRHDDVLIHAMAGPESLRRRWITC